MILAIVEQNHYDFHRRVYRARFLREGQSIAERSDLYTSRPGLTAYLDGLRERFEKVEYLGSRDFELECQRRCS